MSTTAEQLPLWQDARRPSVAERWHAFHVQHEDVLRSIEALALEDARAGERRISTKALVEVARRRHKTPIDNSLTASIADWLVERHPELDALIERRARR